VWLKTTIFDAMSHMLTVVPADFRLSTFSWPNKKRLEKIQTLRKGPFAASVLN
jgi:hypothetical protein